MMIASFYWFRFIGLFIGLDLFSNASSSKMLNIFFMEGDD